ncbi:MAG: ornithine carbamoyltransferase [Ruminococcaceae bacterium]|nr:ornithine carbamoyltransferase [Oscillospiraceae bacterium]
MQKDLLKMSDLNKDELFSILDLAAQLKYENKNGIPHKRLAGKTLGMIFQKSSTRTRVSFEVGMYQLGGQPLFLSSRDLQIGRGEPIEDTARVLSRYLDGIMIRTYAQKEVEDLAKYASIPIINGLTDYAHPCQVLADLLTIREYKGKFDGVKFTYIGDGNNMANSLIVGGLLAGMDVAIATPAGYEPAADVLEFAKAYGSKFTLTTDINEAAKDADVLYTDVWASMGMEDEIQKRQADFKGFCIDSRLMSLAKPDAMVQHCLPAHRGEEIMADVLEAHANELFDEAENRLHAQKAVLVKLMEK